MNIGKIAISSNIQEQVYAALKSEIINGGLEFGTQLKEMDLVETFGVSRSPIREALRRLCGDGLLELRPNCGIFVREFSAKYVSDLLTMRRMMETHGLMQYVSADIRWEDRAELEQLRAIVSTAAEQSDTMELMQHMEIDARLHTFFNSLNHNEIMDETWERMKLVNIVVQRLSLKDKTRARESQQEHLQVLDDLLSGNAEQAIEKNRIHIEHTKTMVVRALGKG